VAYFFLATRVSNYTELFPPFLPIIFVNNIVSRVLFVSGLNAMTRGLLKQHWTMFFKVKGNCNSTIFVVIFCFEDHTVL